MVNLYLFNEECRASHYGIGTYIECVIKFVKENKGIHLTVVYLHSNKKEFEKVSMEGYVILYFPDTEINVKLYYRNVMYIMKSYIHSFESKIIFHLNYSFEYHLIGLMKEWYPSCSVLYTIHYQDWCFLLKGNTSYYKSIIHSDKTKLEDNQEKKIFELYNQEKKLFEAVDRVICLSEYTYKLLQSEYDLVISKMALICNSIVDQYVPVCPEDKDNQKLKWGFGKNEKIILFVGRLDEIKRPDILIEAFKKFQNENLYSRLLIVGEGDFSYYINKCSDCWGKISFLGKLQKEKLFAIYRIADVGVLPSMHEQCSYVAIEMMMLGIPLIVSTSTGLREMVSEKCNKLKVKEIGHTVDISSDELKDLLFEYLNNPELSNLSRSNYLNKYEFSIWKNKMLQMYGLK